MRLDRITQLFRKRFPGDESYDLAQRQTPNVLYALVRPDSFPKAELLDFNEELSREIGLGGIDGSKDCDFLNCNFIPENLETYATAYSGHQFGNWAGQLGDGRAIYVGEIDDDRKELTELQWKGVGATPYSRSADGRAVLRSTVREYLMSEAMHFLGVPTSRSLSLTLSGEMVMRDKLYSGRVRPEKGAFMMRVAKNFFRFGHLEFLASQGREDLLKDLVDFLIERESNALELQQSLDPYLAWFKQVMHKTADLMVQWYRVGFTHGVMNTDNMSLAGITIDYGPFSMLDEYDLNFTPNTTDLPGRRYAFGQQGHIAQWNLWQLANSIAPLVHDTNELQNELDGFSSYFWQEHDQMLARKFGFEQLEKDDSDFFSDWQSLMQITRADYTLFFIKLESFEGSKEPVSFFKEVFYGTLSSTQKEEFSTFIEKYQKRKMRNLISDQQALLLMQKNNPKFTLRNYLLYECFEQLETGDRTLFEQLKSALKSPYEQLYPELSAKRPSGYEDTFGCSTLSCSS
ncbi:protein adenylyltransferase SelO [Chryseobacterium sp. A301]